MKKIYLIDWNSFIYRMFFALPEFSTSYWKMVNATFGMAKFFAHTLTKENPDYIVFVKDAKWENFRHKLYSEYKATRDKMPDNLRLQVDDIEDMIKKMDIDIIDIPWYEADDVIGTLALELWKNQDNQVFILSWDKDLYSLTTNNVSIYDTMKKKIYNWEKTKQKFWVDPKLIIDYLAIVWDKADNIPGIEWFWPKKAIDLINNIWTVEEILKQIDMVDSCEKDINDYDKSIQSCFRWKTFEKLKNSRENAILSKKLATIDLWVKLNKFNLENYIFDKDSILNSEVLDLFKKYEFNSLLDESNIEKMKIFDDMGVSVKTITTDSELDNLSKKIENYTEIVIDTETTSLNYMDAILVWVSIYLDDSNLYYINRMHDWDKVSDDVLKTFLNKLLNSDMTIIGHNLKYDLEIIELFLKNNYKKYSQNDWQIALNL